MIVLRCDREAWRTPHTAKQTNQLRKVLPWIARVCRGDGLARVGLLNTYVMNECYEIILKSFVNYSPSN